eukprot:1158451-Pelagomonas_calceolata.AAC.1
MQPVYRVYPHASGSPPPHSTGTTKGERTGGRAGQQTLSVVAISKCTTAQKQYDLSSAVNAFSARS